jgi:hypothetical protein
VLQTPKCAKRWVEDFPSTRFTKSFALVLSNLIASRQPEGWRADALGAPHVGERTEAKLISDFVEKIGQLRPQLVTFNGHSFDARAQVSRNSPRRLAQNNPKYSRRRLYAAHPRLLPM